ncbi:hypothetical protein PHMEG_00032068 [Phytophthora megakarya]|uniref:Uncharacterized protein n=1 Tax=Phytophthora megakarya TaxID=4795 RepID=A0A225UY12_9STRA|nr:hypothetical protein PHMEG_00032068 [Phytophthora megakarya]
MLAKLLLQPIYLVVARNGLDKASYQIFRPMQKNTSTHELQSAGEFNFRKEEADKWVDELKKDGLQESDHFMPTTGCLTFWRSALHMVEIRSNTNYGRTERNL